MKKTPLIFFILFITTIGFAQDRVWKSGLELGTGLSFTGYNANLAYVGTLGKNVFYAGPKIVFSDANALFDTPWGGQIGYRRNFPISARFNAFLSLEYQLVLFEYDELETDALNSIQEFHFSYGIQYFINTHWSIGNSIGGGGYIERIVDPFDGRVDLLSGYSSHIRLFCSYHF